MKVTLKTDSVRRDVGWLPTTVGDSLGNNHGAIGWRDNMKEAKGK